MPQTLKKVILALAATSPAVAALGDCVWAREAAADAPAPAVAVVPATAPARSTVVQVKIDNFTFSPAALTVPAGTTVTWTNRDDVPHTVTSSAKPRAFASSALDTDDHFSHVFTTPGTYSYFCAVHPHMTGQIIVK